MKIVIIHYNLLAVCGQQIKIFTEYISDYG